MVHKSSIIPGLSKFIDTNILSHYPETSMKRILMAGGLSLYLKQSEGMLESLINNPLVSGLGVIHDNGMIDIETVKDVLKEQINKAGYMRLTIPIIGDVDFTTDDVDALFKFIVESNTTVNKPITNIVTSSTNNITGEVY